MKLNKISLLLSLMIIGLLLPLSASAQLENASLGGYGELHYNDVVYDENNPQTPGELDFHRFILFVGYNFNDWISFRSELELEHTLIEPGEGGEVALEQAYVDLRIKPTFGVRAGLLLVPVGIINPVHEPPTFNGVERPNVERNIIPTTWRESGIGIYGEAAEGLSYQLYAMAGLDASEIGGTGIRSARQNGFESSTDNFAVTGRLDYQPTLNLILSGSYFFSDLSTNATFGDAMQGTTFHLGEFHAQYQNRGFEARLLGVYSFITEIEQLNATFNNGAGESQYGAYLELGYDLLRLGNLDTEQQLILFGRGEVYDTQLTTVGLSANPENERYEYTAGFTYKPAPRVAFKADYQILQSAGIKNIHQLNVGVGYNF
ncbi:MAG: outer membrane beta-barrel protein [Balneolaceae bacterium]|nr:outer membrane beta-barrel protein [Balneolaceae bacterium]